MVASAQWVEEASRAIDAGDYDRATSLLERAVSVEPNNGRAFYYYGLAMGERGRPGAALSLFQKAEILLQGDARALGETYAQMGTNLERLGRRAEAVRRYEQALAQDPSNAHGPPAHRGTAWVTVSWPRQTLRCDVANGAVLRLFSKTIGFPWRPRLMPLSSGVNFAPKLPMGSMLS